MALVSCNSYKAGYKTKLEVGMPHELKEKDRIDRISISESLLNHNKIDLFRKHMVTAATLTSLGNDRSRIIVKRWQSQDSRPEGSLHMFGRIGKESTMSYSSTTKILISTFSVNSWTV